MGEAPVDIGQIIAKKRDHQELSRDEIAGVVSGFTRGDIAPGPMAAFLMGVFLNGMTPRESADLTLAMVDSGRRLDLSAIAGTKVDKHSTGGVGDKTTLVVAPLVAALGVPVPKISGRSLGHTGGTIDKLESVPGLTTDLSPDRFLSQVAEIGVAIAAQTADMVPADKKIYALRDATATVESIPLIASSVMSKKLAVGADAIVLDVKAGAGAFMPDLPRAQQLARAMVEIGSLAQKQVVALVTRMDQPLGSAVGDAVEFAEAIATLRGAGPPDFVTLCEVVAGHMLALGGAASNAEEGATLARHGLQSGAGTAKLREMIAAQGGEAAIVDDPDSLLKTVPRRPVALSGEGYVVALDARRIGLAVRALKEAAQQQKPLCGLLLQKKVGDEVSGDPVAALLIPAEAAPAADRVIQEIQAAFTVSPSPPLVAGIHPSP